MTNPATAQILQRISMLPPLPAAIGRLLRLVNDPDGDFQEIARTISLDQTLTVQLLRIANSAFYGFSHQIRTVQQATVILGRHAVRNMALSLAMITLRNRMQTSWPLSPEVFWRHSMGVACGARLLARTVRGADPEEAFVAGLLHDIGKIILMEHDARTYKRLLREAEGGSKPLHALEQAAFGIDHAGVGLALCQHWNIPDALGAATAAHHGEAAEGLSADARQLAAFVQAADVLAKLAWIGDGGNPLVPSSWRAAAGGLAFPTDALHQLLEALPAEVARNEQIFFQTPQAAPAAADNGGREEDPAFSVAVHLASPEHRELVTLLLFTHRIRTAEAPDGPPPAAVIVDEGLADDRRAAYQAAGAAVLDFGAWRAQHAASAWINVLALQNWLIQNFSAPAVAL